MRTHLFLPLFLMLGDCFISCSDHHWGESYERIESLMEEHPDSALEILNDIDTASLKSEKDKAEYALSC